MMKEKVNLLSCERYNLLPFSGLALLLSNLLSACGGTSDPAAQQSSDEPTVTVDPAIDTKDAPSQTSHNEPQPWLPEPIITYTPPNTYTEEVTNDDTVTFDDMSDPETPTQEPCRQYNNLTVIPPGRVVFESSDIQDFNLFPSAFHDADSNIYLTGLADEPIENPSYIGSKLYPLRLLKLDTNFEPVLEFGVNGIVSTPFPTANYFTDGSNQDSNYIYAEGFGESSFVITRVVRETGALDTEFANNGILEISLNEFPDYIDKPNADWFNAMLTALDNDELLITHTVMVAQGWGVDPFMMVQKITKEGVIDTEFGNNGFLLLHNSNADNLYFTNDPHNNLIYDPVNKTFLLVGYDHEDMESLYINRYDINGELDKTFANDGYYEIHQNELPEALSFTTWKDLFYYNDDEDALYLTHLQCCESNDNQNWAIIKLSYNTDKTKLSLDEYFGNQGVLVTSSSGNTVHFDAETIDDRLVLIGENCTIIDKEQSSTSISDNNINSNLSIEKMVITQNTNEEKLETNSVNTAFPTPFPITNFMFDTVMNENSIDSDQHLLTSSLSDFHDGSGVLLSLTNDQLQNPNLAVMHENTQETLLIGMADWQYNHGIFDFDAQFDYLPDNLAPDGTITVALSSSAPGIRFAYTGDEEIGFKKNQNDGIANASFELTGENYNQFHSIEIIADEVNEDTDIKITVASTYTDEFVSFNIHEVNEERTFVLTIHDSDNDAFLG